MTYSGQINKHTANEARRWLRAGISKRVADFNGIRIEKSVIIDRERAELYRFWRNFENLPHIMHHLAKVQMISPTRSHWVAKAPAGASVEWDAEITHDNESELIAWRALEGSKISNAGTVRFLYFAEGQTEVRVSLEYDPPGGRLGDWIAGLLGENPEQQITDALARFKQMMEIEFRPAEETLADAEVI